MSIMKPEKRNAKMVSVRIPAELLEEFDSLKEAGAQYGLTISLTEIFVEALHDAVSEGRKEVACNSATKTTTRKAMKENRQ